jgi:hypothetical protein
VEKKRTLLPAVIRRISQVKKGLLKSLGTSPVQEFVCRAVEELVFCVTYLGNEYRTGESEKFFFSPVLSPRNKKLQFIHE